MLGNHADKTARCEPRVHVAEFAAPDPRTDIIREDFVVAKSVRPEKAMRELMILQRRIQINPREIGIFHIPPKNLLGQPREHTSRRGAVQPLSEFALRFGARTLALHYGPVQILLVREMTEQDCLVYAGETCDLPRSSSAKAFLGEEPHRHIDDLLAAVHRRHATGSWGHCK